MRLPDELCCLEHGLRLTSDADGEQITGMTSALVCDAGCRVPVVGGIPRFVTSDNYAASFGRQWKRFRRTQLDSFTGLPISRERLARCLGGSLECIKDKTVLEIGCGAGRFTEVLLDAGARVFASDLSVAVEANYDNCQGAPNYFICQADLRRLPVRPGTFDIVLCLGVIQHTPSPEETIAELCSYVRPGGLLVIDHYRYDAEDMTPTRQSLRRFLLRRPPRVSLAGVRLIVALLWPVHRLLWWLRRRPAMATIRQKWLAISPVLDYHDYYGALGPRLLYAWAALDTHDALTDRYKHKRTPDEIRDHLARLGMKCVHVNYGGNGVEARARKPLMAQ
jgi:SAM-dependent methyltransferase